MNATLFPFDTGRSARISDCGLYRYELRRCWGDADELPVNFLMLNPSTADGMKDDATLRKITGYAKAWGRSSLVVTNLFAFRSTDPAGLATAADPIGPDNDRTIEEVANRSACVVCGWGAHKGIDGRVAAVKAILARTHVSTFCLALTKGGHPGHPLFLPGKAERMPYDLGGPDVCRRRP